MAEAASPPPSTATPADPADPGRATVAATPAPAADRAAPSPRPPAPRAAPAAPPSVLRRSRRPSGDPPPLPRDWNRHNVTAMVVFATFIIAWLASYTVSGSSPVQRLDQDLVELAARLRTGSIVRAAQIVNGLDRPMWLSSLALATILGAIALRRFRRAFVQLGALLVAFELVDLAEVAVDKPRPFQVEIIGRWAGYGAPSTSGTCLAVILIGGAFCFLPAGRRRWLAGGVTIALAALLAVAKAVLGTSTPLSVLAGTALGALVTVAAFSTLVPDQVFPLRLRGRAAHLDLDVRRPAIAEALARQLGVRLLDLEPFGLAASGGSSPMKLRVDGNPPQTLFGKLYATQHVRADRWYKFGRTLLYGRLEDERPFRTVRRLVQYEDYLLRMMRDAGLPVVNTYGFVELTPEREYLLVTDFAHGAREISDREVRVDERLIDDGLEIIRLLWDAGLAHRDIKPGNLLVRNGRMVLIDVAFAEIRPSPWRQAVDLANMMLVLALRTDAETVYRRALRRFRPEEVAEAFAASRGVTLPSQSRAMLASDRRDLLGQFRALAPPRRQVRIQRWSARRVGLWIATLLGGVAAAALVTGAVLGQNPAAVRPPGCSTSTPVLLFGQSAPRAAYVPCIAGRPVGGAVATTVDDRSGRVTFPLPTGGRVLVTFAATCSAKPGEPVVGPVLPPTVVAARAPAPAGTGRMLLTFADGCIDLTYPQADFGPPQDALPRLLSVVHLVARGALDAEVSRLTDGRETRL
jgi:tRNA A-37 threonylcarbamoyl transferase component Bud32/membrane-associated phospholipid phosphatase